MFPMCMQSLRPLLPLTAELNAASNHVLHQLQYQEVLLCNFLQLSCCL